MQQSEEERIRKRNLKVELINRRQDEQNYTIEEPKPVQRDLYPWEEPPIGTLAKITKEDFRNKGKEYVYPVLIQILNYVQKTTGRKVVITCGYSSTSNSKHRVGAEVDFYVQGMEKKPQEVAKIVMGFYQQEKTYKKDKAFTQFTKVNTKNAFQSWSNKELILHLHDANNQHPYPYLTLELCWDKETQEKIT